MAILKIGITSYINALPFHLAFKEAIPLPHCEFHFAPPAQLNQLLREGSLDISLISSVEFLQGNYHFLFPYGIGAKNHIHSVNFYFKSWKPHLHCHVTSESATSVALLKILAKKYWNISLHLDSSHNREIRDYDAFLLIGNQALEMQSCPGYEKIDLAENWYKHTGKFFVFALMAAKKIDEQTLLFCQKLEEALHWSRMNFPQILHVASQRSGHAPSFLERYFRSHTYELSHLFMDGLKLFETNLMGGTYDRSISRFCRSRNPHS